MSTNTTAKRLTTIDEDERQDLMAWLRGAQLALQRCDLDYNHDSPLGNADSAIDDALSFLRGLKAI